MVQWTADNKMVWPGSGWGVDLLVHSDGSVGFLGLPSYGTEYSVYKRVGGATQEWGRLGWQISVDPTTLNPRVSGPTYESISFDRTGAVFAIRQDHKLLGPYQDRTRQQIVGQWYGIAVPLPDLVGIVDLVEPCGAAPRSHAADIRGSERRGFRVGPGSESQVGLPPGQR